MAAPKTTKYSTVETTGEASDSQGVRQKRAIS